MQYIYSSSTCAAPGLYMVKYQFVNGEIVAT